MKKTRLFKIINKPKSLLAVMLIAWLQVMTFQVSAQDSATLQGKVLDEMGQGLPGSTVRVDGTNTGTVTDVDGNYTITAPLNSTIKISFIGYTPTSFVFTGQASQATVLELNVTQMEEMVVVGYGTVKKSDLTGSVAGVDVESIQKIASVDVARNLQGKVAGVQVTTNSGAPGKGTNIRVRGTGSFQNSNPLFVVDGLLTGDISNISPNDIESMEVLKDASATAIYASRGSNGVIIITTKSGEKNSFHVDVNAYGGVQQVWKTHDLLNAEEYATLYVEAESGPGAEWDEDEVDDELQSWIEDALDGKIEGTDWQKEVLRTASIYSADASVYGGTEKIRQWKLIQKSIPVNYFKQQSIIKGNRKVDIEAVLDVFAFKSIDEFESKNKEYTFSHFRKSAAFAETRNHVIAWSMVAEYKARNIKPKKSFNQNQKDELISKLRKLLEVNSNVVEGSKNLLLKYGIKLFTLDRPSKTPVDGKSFMSGEFPTIVLSLKYKRLDNFAYNLMHELGHVYKHLTKKNIKKGIFLYQQYIK